MIFGSRPLTLFMVAYSASSDWTIGARLREGGHFVLKAKNFLTPVLVL